MSATETDLELLECYLDDELSPGESESLRKRLSADPELALVMDDLRSQREMRQQFFSTIKPSDQAVESLIRSVRKSMTKEMVWAERARSLRWIGSAAACLLVGFMGGYGIRGKAPATPGVVQSTATVANAGQERQPRDVVVGPQFQPIIPFGTGTASAGTMNGGTQPVGYQVNLIDESGNVLGVQRFKTLEQARQYQNELRNMQNQQKLAPNTNTYKVNFDQY